MPKHAKFAIVIKTDSYAGNFERELCAHTTGHVGECEVGDSFVEESIEEKFEPIIGNEPDDNGCWRPVGLGCDIDGYTNQDVVIYFNEQPTPEHIEIVKERANSYNSLTNDKIEVKGIELIEFKSSIKVTKY